MLGAAPSYASVVRFMKVQGLIKRTRRGPLHSPGAQATEHRIETREIRHYRSEGFPFLRSPPVIAISNA